MFFKRMKNQKGFSLVEAVVSMFILTIVLLCIAAHAGVTAKQIATDKNYTVANTVIQDKFEELKQKPFNSINSGGDSVLKNGCLFYRTWNVTISNGNMKTITMVTDWAPGKSVTSKMTVTQ